MTFNEELHIERCLDCLRMIADRLIIIDCGSNDKTVEIGRALGAEIFAHEWVNHANQLNWALDNTDIKTTWTMRVDADEWFPETSLMRIKAALADGPQQETGIELCRYTNFLGKPIRHGGLSPQWLLRIWRTGKGRCEEKWMDEHVVLTENAIIRKIDAEFYDDNLRNISWWIDKHNRYATAEMFDFYRAQGMLKIPNGLNKETKLRRFAKQHVYGNLPLGSRAVGYYFYRIILRLGVLDGASGIMFHTMQGLWYRLLVDLKIMEVRQYCKKKNKTPIEAIRDIHGVDLRAENA